MIDRFSNVEAVLNHLCRTKPGFCAPKSFGTRRRRTISRALEEKEEGKEA